MKKLILILVLFASPAFAVDWQAYMDMQTNALLTAEESVRLATCEQIAVNFEAAMTLFKTACDADCASTQSTNRAKLAKAIAFNAAMNRCGHEYSQYFLKLRRFLRESQ